MNTISNTSLMLSILVSCPSLNRCCLNQHLPWLNKSYASTTDENPSIFNNFFFLLVFCRQASQTINSLCWEQDALCKVISVSGSRVRYQGKVGRILAKMHFPPVCVNLCVCLQPSATVTAAWLQLKLLWVPADLSICRMMALYTTVEWSETLVFTFSLWHRALSWFYETGRQSSFKS